MNDDQLRALLTDAVSDVGPTRDLDTAIAPRPRVHWLAPTVAAALATVLALTGAVWLGQRETSPPPAAAPRAISVVVWDVVTTPGGYRLASDRRAVSTDDPLLAAVEATVDDVVGDVDVFVSVTQGQQGVTVDLAVGEDDRFEMDLDSPPDLLPQAVAWTVASATDPRDPVRVTLTGAPDTPWSETDLSQPVVPDPTVLAPVTVESIGSGETVSSPFTVSGLAATFEGTVVWTLVADGQTVREGFATAEECCTASPYSFVVEAPPGTYTLDVRETDPSDGEGKPVYGVARRVVVE